MTKKIIATVMSLFITLIASGCQLVERENIHTADTSEITSEIEQTTTVTTTATTSASTSTSKSSVVTTAAKTSATSDKETDLDAWFAWLDSDDDSASGTPANSNLGSNTQNIPVISFKNTDFVQYNYADKNLKIRGSRPTLYDFMAHKSVGVGGNNTTVRDTEMNYGVTADITRNAITYRLYDNASVGLSAVSTKLYDDNTSTEIKTADFTATSYDISSLTNGLYRLRTRLSTRRDLDLYFYVNGDEAFLCSADYLSTSDIATAKARREKIYKLLNANDLTLSDYTDTSELCYPYYPYDSRYACDTQKWIDLSNQICRSDWSDEHKIYAIHEWMTRNLAYDFYRTDVIKSTRARYYSDWSGTHATYTNHVGTCADFSNIFLTMCRAQNIPVTTVNNDTHAWNIVYVNGLWIEVDMTVDIKRSVYGEDTTKISKADRIYNYKGYFVPSANSEKPAKFEAVDAIVCDFAFVTGKDKTHAK